VSALFDVSGRVALVTGASGGLGRHLAATLAKGGATVVLAARRKEQLETAVAEIAEQGGTALAVAMDVTDEASVERAITETTERCGPATIVVNNSGVTAARDALSLDCAEWDRVLDTNTRSAWLVSRTAARRLIERGIPGTIAFSLECRVQVAAIDDDGAARHVRGRIRREEEKRAVKLFLAGKAALRDAVDESKPGL
jgi:NAD(P)-dependent dehydrogenase (short-subunit alcohol dehydrogenase family)